MYLHSFLFDIFILPSLAEALDRSLLESMTLVKPVVAPRVGGIPAAVEDGKTGILLSPQNSPALARTLAFMLDNPEKMWREGRKGQRNCLTMKG